MRSGLMTSSLLQRLMAILLTLKSALNAPRRSYGISERQRRNQSTPWHDCNACRWGVARHGESVSTSERYPDKDTAWCEEKQEAMAYYTTDADDALATAQSMSKQWMDQGMNMEKRTSR